MRTKRMKEHNKSGEKRAARGSHDPGQWGQHFVVVSADSLHSIVGMTVLKGSLKHTQERINNRPI